MTLNTDLTDFLDSILAAFTDNLQLRVQGHAVSTYLQGSAQMISWGHTQKGLEIKFEGPPLRQAIEFANKRAAQLVTQMNEETKKRLAEVIGKGIEEKRGIPGLARDIRKEFDDMTKYRSELIAKSETRDALFHASQDRMEDMGITGKEWVLGSGGREGNCDDCRANAAVGIIPVNQEFPIPQYEIHPGCLLPDVIVEASNIIAGTRAFYRGNAVEIITENGNRLTITPNHMILTKAGFVKAKTLHEGDYIISSIDSERIVSSIDPDNYYRPTCIADIWNSLMVKQGMVRCSVPVTPHYFYGDAGAFDGNVDIVYPDGFLLGEVFGLFFFEHISKDKLYGTGAYRSTLACFRSQFSFGNSGMSAPSSDMSIGSNGVAALDRHSGHPYKTSLATIPRSDTRLNEVATEDSPVYTDLSSEFLLRFASQITLDKIIKVRDFYFSGHVYDLQSLDRLYIANHIVVKNCTCAMAPAMLKG